MAKRPKFVVSITDEKGADISDEFFVVPKSAVRDFRRSIQSFERDTRAWFDPLGEAAKLRHTRMSGRKDALVNLNLLEK